MGSKNKRKAGVSTETRIPLGTGDTQPFLGRWLKTVHVYLNLEKNCLLPCHTFFFPLISLSFYGFSANSEDLIVWKINEKMGVREINLSFPFPFFFFGKLYPSEQSLCSLLSNT